MNCMLIKTTSATEDIIVGEGLNYSYSLPQEPCSKVLVVGPLVEGKGIPLLGAFSKATVDRRIGQVHPAFGAAMIGQSWDYVWYLTAEKKFHDTYLPVDELVAAGIDLELGGRTIQFTCREIAGLAELGLAETEDNILAATPEAEALHLKKSSKATKAKAKKDEAAKAKRAAQQKVREEAARQCGPEPMIPAEEYHVGEEVLVDVGLGAMKKTYQGTVVAVEDRFVRNPMNPAEEIRNDQIVSVELVGGSLRKFSARTMRQNDKNRA